MHPDLTKGPDGVPRPCGGVVFYLLNTGGGGSSSSSSSLASDPDSSSMSSSESDSLYFRRFSWFFHSVSFVFDRNCATYTGGRRRATEVLPYSSESGRQARRLARK